VNVIDLLRDATARRTALYAYAQAHDHFAEQEQAFQGEGRMVEAEDAHQFALIALRGYRAELDDPAPRRIPIETEGDFMRGVDYDDNAREGWR
jgi:hypothetical protein